MENSKLSKILLLCMLATASFNMAHAAVVVLQPLDPTRPGEFSNLGPSNQQAADDFTLTQGTILDSISWFGRYGADNVSAPNPTAFSIRFFEDNAGAPTNSPILQLDITAAPVDSGSDYVMGAGSPMIPWYSYSASLPALTLDADTYWVSILENDLGTPLVGATQWLWADTDTSGLRSIRNNDGEAWSSSQDINHAFSLSGTAVPVPAAFWLFGTALMGLIGFSKRKAA